jgi:hypothetical protein
MTSFVNPDGKSARRLGRIRETSLAVYERIRSLRSRPVW